MGLSASGCDLYLRYSASLTLKYTHTVLLSESVVSRSPSSTRLPSRTWKRPMMPSNGARISVSDLCASSRAPLRAFRLVRTLALRQRELVGRHDVLVGEELRVVQLDLR